MDGYGVASQDVRGTGLSSGKIGFNGNKEHEDGYDAVEWLASQPFCDGNVGMFGLSYPGFVQTAAAAFAPPHLKAICPFMAPSQNPFGARQTHTLHMSHLFWAYSQLLKHPEHYLPDPVFRKKTLPLLKKYNVHLEEILLELPLNRCRAAAIEGVPMLDDYRELMEGIESHSFWKKMNMPINFDNVHTASFYATGWLDGAKEWTIASYLAQRKSSNPYTRENVRLLIGPWPHDSHLPSVVENTDFGDESSGANCGVTCCMHRWFDRYLKKKSCDALPTRVRFFMRGENKWLTASDWPPPKAEYQSYYLSVEHGLDLNIPNEGTLEYLADPMKPTPSSIKDKNGHILTADWSEINDRTDILTFTTAPLNMPIRIAGEVRMTLFAATTADDTDFGCRLLDITPDGTAIELAAGIIRASYRKGFFKKEFIIPNEIICYSIHVGHTAVCIQAGHQIGLQVFSYLYPDHDRNLNTSVPSYLGANSVVAHQTVYMGSENPSCIILPILWKIKEEF
jgi:putative CocE/NonD family hydrolase